MVLLWGIPSIKAELDKSAVLITVEGLHNQIVKKVSKPEDGLKKIAKVNEEIDKQLAALSPTDPKQVRTCGQTEGVEGDGGCLCAG